MYKKIDRCRICGNTELAHVLDLGVQELTGVFPSDITQAVTAGPLRLVKCHGTEACGLLQLEHSYDLGEMYGDNYGYRSGLNSSMVEHLRRKVARILDMVNLDHKPTIVDIGSNDSTTLQAYPEVGCNLIGIDPTGKKFSQYYPPHVRLIPDFFSATRFRAELPSARARIVTSFSMFYDLENPMQFVHDVAEILDDEGVWVFEQSYMPLMLQRNSYDTVCHEHLEYYSLKQIKWMMDRAGLKIVDVEFNDVNGGSFSVMAARCGASFSEYPRLRELLDKEISEGLDSLNPYLSFADRVAASKLAILDFIAAAKMSGKRVAALGASTKGNVLLQYVGLTTLDLEAVGEVNQDKFGCFTPGSRIPIVSEAELFKNEPDYLLVLPWHFREFFLSKYKLSKAHLIFPLPNLEVVEPYDQR